MKMKEKGKRKNERVGISLEVYGQDGKLIGSIINVSCDGCFIKTKKSFDKNKDIFLISIGLPCAHHKIDIMCMATWSQKNGIGAKIIMDDYNRSIFTNCIDGLSMLKKTVQQEKRS